MIQVVYHHVQVVDTIIKENALHAKTHVKHAKMDQHAPHAILVLSCKQANVFKNVMMASIKIPKMFVLLVIQLALNVLGQKYQIVSVVMMDSSSKEPLVSQDVLMENI